MDAFFSQLAHTISPTLVVLIALSVVTLGVGLERLATTLRNRSRLARSRRDILAHLKDDNITMAQAINSTGAWHPATPLFDVVLDTQLRPTSEVKRGHNRIIRGARRRLWILGSIGSLAPFVGLLGTVIGVMQAFAAMGQQGAGGFETVSAGLSEALITTAAGIFVAIEAMLLYNYLQVCLAAYAAELRESIEEINEAAHGQEAGDGRQTA